MIAVYSKRHNDQNARLCRYPLADAFIVTTDDVYAHGRLKRALKQITCSKRVPVFPRTLHAVHFLLLHDMLQTRRRNYLTSAYRTSDNKGGEGRFKKQCLEFLSLPLLGVSNGPLQFKSARQNLAFARNARKN